MYQVPGIRHHRRWYVHYQTWCAAVHFCPYIIPPLVLVSHIFSSYKCWFVEFSSTWSPCNRKWRISPAPRHTFSRGVELTLVPGSSYNPNTPRIRALLDEGDGFFFMMFLESLRPIYQKNVIFNEPFWGRHSTTNISEKCYFQQAILRAAFESPLNSRRSKFLRKKKKKKKKNTKIQAEIRVRDVTGSFEICETHRQDFFIGRETLPLVIPQVELLWEIYDIRNLDKYSWFSAQQPIFNWFWPHLVLRFGWPSVTLL